ncbi:hypothetical protein FA15DRAFT_668535 [Coprinopsis marcescibilis]|uniref:Uncharacterized protein n=1 Tax=Coprinopsis marcescibilis TaxID=230819 RepID=A0A5C3KYT8_COPMA|nr:hypothetical protein FA15DRAFT_668535 [Coprinopsis marcescibilis]
MPLYTKADTVSELLPFLSHNEPLPDSLIPKCAYHRKPIIDKISGLDKQIQPLLKELSQLQSEREELVAERIKYDTLLSPTRHFPDDLVALVLRYSLDGPLDSKGRQHFTVLRAVCKQWRYVAFATSEIWRRVTLDIVRDFPSVPLRAQGGLWDSIFRWFWRAGANKPCSLRLIQDTPEGHGHPEPFHMRGFMKSFFDGLGQCFISGVPFETILVDFQFFSSHSRRSFSQSHLNKMANIERLTLASTRNLQTWTIDHEFDDSKFFYLNSFQSFEDALPKLRVLHLGGWCCDSGIIQQSQFHHSELTSLHISSCCFEANESVPDYFLGIISTELPRLEELILEKVRVGSVGVSHPSSSTNIPRTYRHTNLKNLVVNGKRSIRAISNLILPSLVYLRILHDDRPGCRDGDEVYDDKDLPCPVEIAPTVSRLLETATLHTLSLSRQESLNICTTAGSDSADLLSQAQCIRHLEIPDCTALERIDIDIAVKTNGLAALESVFCRNACTPEDFVRIHGAVVDWMTRQHGRSARLGSTTDRLKIYQRFVDEDTRLVGNVEAEYLKALDALRNVGVDVITGWANIPGPSFPHYDDCPFES